MFNVNHRQRSNGRLSTVNGKDPQVHEFLHGFCDFGKRESASEGLSNLVKTTPWMSLSIPQNGIRNWIQRKQRHALGSNKELATSIGDRLSVLWSELQFHRRCLSAKQISTQQLTRRKYLNLSMIQSLNDSMSH
jgi:hypothetical protein